MSTFRFRRLCLAAALAAAGIAPGQLGGAQSDSKPWSDLKFDQHKKVKLNFVASSIDAIVRFFSNASGIVIVKDPSLNGVISLSTPAPVPIGDALSILSASLELKGYQLLRKDSFLVIKETPKPTTTRSMGSGGPYSGFGPGQGMATRPTSELRTYLLKYASASSVAKSINDAFSQSNTSSFGGFAGGPPGMGGGPGGGGPGGLDGFPSRTQSSPTSQGTVKASYDEYSNTVIVNAPASLQLQVSALIQRIDVDVKQPLMSKLYTLKYAVAEDLATTIQNVLNANATKGRGSTTQTTETRVPFGFTASSTSTQGGVTYDSRSNSLIVTTTDENQTIVADLLTGLDKPVVSADASAVIPLANARAADVASLLNQAFGSRSGSKVSTSTASTSKSTSSSATSSTRSNSGFGLSGSVEPDPGNLYVQLKDPEADAGELATQVSVQQGFPPFGQFGGSSSSSSSSQKTSTTSVSRDSEGRVVGTTDLIGKVTIVADPNTNSLIVVGDPDAVDRIKSILDQLDRIPQQVVIETMIVEASLDSESKLGMEWSFAQSKLFGVKGSSGSAEGSFGLQSTTGTNQGFNYTVASSNLSAYLNAFKSDQRFQVLSTPRIFTSNNVEATINISQSIPYVTSTREDTNGNLSYNYSFEDVGIVLTVTPQISPSGTVTMSVTQTANELQSYTSFDAPIVSQREATTTVSVKDGDTVVLGGIMQKTVSSTTKKIPLLGDIPLLGQIFRSTSKSDTRTELMVFLTPHIVKNAGDAKAVSDKQVKELSPETKKLAGG